MRWKWILYALLSSLLAGAALVASQSQQENDSEFEPTEKLPADSSVSFPVDI
jgi:hypothetical protein